MNKNLIFKQEGYEIWLFNEKTVEIVVMLSNKSSDSHINVKAKFGEGEGKVPLDAIAERAKKYQPKPKITYKMIQEYVEKNMASRYILNISQR